MPRHLRGNSASKLQQLFLAFNRLIAGVEDDGAGGREVVPQIDVQKGLLRFLIDVGLPIAFKLRANAAVRWRRARWMMRREVQLAK
jgi:hypothetical protein